MEQTESLEKASNHGFVRDGHVYRSAFRDFPEREIGTVKETDEAALLYFTKRFDLLEAKVTELEAHMAEADNKGSYLNKILFLKDHMAVANAIGPIDTLLDKLQDLEDSLRGPIAGNRQRNLDIKTSLVERMEGLKDETDFKALAETLREMRMNWIKTGPVPTDLAEALDERYAIINQHFFDQRREYIEHRTAQIQERTAHYESVLERLRALLAPDVHPGHMVKTLNALAQEWKEVGNIPKEGYEERREIFRNLKRNIMFTAKRLFREKAKKAGIAPRPLTPEEIEQNNNFKLKITLLEEAKALLDKGDFRGAYPKVKEMQAAWHNIGPLAKNKIFINKDFVYLCDRISEFSFLNKMLYQSNPYYFRLSPRDLATAKLNIMRDIIRKEEADIENFTDQLRGHEAAGANMMSTEIKALGGRVHSQSRRLGVKKEILNELRKEIDALLTPTTK